MTPTLVCNLALARLGEAQITSVNEASTAGRACLLHFDVARDEVLRSHRWNFAQKRAVLTALVEVPLFGWAYQYELPADCLRVLEVNDSEFGQAECNRWEVEGNKRLLTDADEVKLIYVARIEAAEKWDPLFVSALVVYLAAKLSETLRGSTPKTAELMEEYQRMTAPLARRIDANETSRRHGRIELNSRAIAARFRGI